MPVEPVASFAKRHIQARSYFSGQVDSCFLEKDHEEFGDALEVFLVELRRTPCVGTAIARVEHSTHEGLDSAYGSSSGAGTHEFPPAYQKIGQYIILLFRQKINGA